MGYGQQVDSVIGTLSRFLHVRSATHDTSGDLGPYLDVPVEALLPAPAHVPAVRRATPFLSSSRVTETLSWTSEHEPLCRKYKHRHQTEYAKNLTAYARWMHPRGTRRRSLLIYVHGWLEPGSWVEEATLLPLWYRELGVDTAHVQLPFHGRRRPKGQLFHGEWFWTADLVRSIEAVRQAVMDVRSAMAWFRDLGYEEIGVTGLSLGGSITMLTACVSPTPDYVVPMIAHLALAEAVEEAGILWRMKSDLDRFGVGREKRGELFRRLTIGSAKPVLAPERQLWVAAREDAYLKADLVSRQAAAWQNPEVLWIDGGHMTFPLAMESIVTAMKRMPKIRGLRGGRGGGARSIEYGTGIRRLALAAAWGRRSLDRIRHGPAWAGRDLRRGRDPAAPPLTFGGVERRCLPPAAGPNRSASFDVKVVPSRY